MQEVKGNLWTFDAEWRGITTNGYVNKAGECVMGRGCALEAKLRHPAIARELGALVRRYGNVFQVFHLYHILALPVKHNWWEKADLELIKKSIGELFPFAESYSNERIVIPRPGCGNGKLRWDTVKPLLEDLPDNVYVISPE